MLHYPIVPFLIAGSALFIWLLMTLAILDAEHLWLPDWLTLPGIAFGFLYTMLKNRLIYEVTYDFGPATPPITLGAVNCILTILAAAGLILLIRWVYWLVRKREGIGLGDAKLMALLAAWLGLPGALVAFALGVALGTITALVLLVLPKRAGETEAWTAMKLPLGTFLCIGGIVSGLWGLPIIAAYLRWAGFY
jgi:leader peptidase (prepilin peptidase)/N-methyltransferase